MLTLTARGCCLILSTHLVVENVVYGTVGLQHTLERAVARKRWVGYLNKIGLRIAATRTGFFRLCLVVRRGAV